MLVGALRFPIVVFTLCVVLASGCGKQKTVVGKPLPEGGFKAEIKVEYAPATLKPSSVSKVRVIINNKSNSVWPARGLPDGSFAINLGDHWLDKDGKILILDSQRTGLPHDIRPGEIVSMEIPISAPASAGNYTVEYDMVQEMVSWFKDKGSPTAQVSIKVE